MIGMPPPMMGVPPMMGPPPLQPFGAPGGPRPPGGTPQTWGMGMTGRVPEQPQWKSGHAYPQFLFLAHPARKFRALPLCCPFGVQACLQPLALLQRLRPPAARRSAAQPSGWAASRPAWTPSPWHSCSRPAAR